VCLHSALARVCDDEETLCAPTITNSPAWPWGQDRYPARVSQHMMPLTPLAGLQQQGQRFMSEESCCARCFYMHHSRFSRGACVRKTSCAPPHLLPLAVGACTTAVPRFITDTCCCMKGLHLVRSTNKSRPGSKPLYCSPVFGHKLLLRNLRLCCCCSTRLCCCITGFQTERHGTQSKVSMVGVLTCL
jgi:hypothetical protein